MTTPSTAVVRLAARGAGWGAFAGFVAGLTAPWIGLAILHLDPLALVLMVFYGWFSAPVGAVYGLVCGVIVFVAAAPFRHDPARLRRLRPLWALLGAAGAAGLSTVAFSPSLEPGPNETQVHVRDDMMLLYGAPCVAAALAAGSLVPRLVPRGPRP